MGIRGPVPERTGNLIYEKTRKGPEVTNGLLREVIWPEPDAEWHPIALMIWDAAQNSGQADFYQQSDVAYLYSLCEDVSYYKTGQKASTVNRKTGEVHTYDKPRSGQMLASIYSAMGVLLLTEGDRRRAAIELQREPEKEADLALVAELDLYRDVAKGSA